MLDEINQPTVVKPGFAYGRASCRALTLQSELGFPFLSQLSDVGRKALIEQKVR